MLGPLRTFTRPKATICTPSGSGSVSPPPLLPLGDSTSIIASDSRPPLVVTVNTATQPCRGVSGTGTYSQRVASLSRPSTGTVSPSDNLPTTSYCVPGPLRTLTV